MNENESEKWRIYIACSCDIWSFHELSCVEKDTTLSKWHSNKQQIQIRSKTLKCNSISEKEYIQIEHRKLKKR